MANLITTNLTAGGASPVVNLDNVLQVSKVGSAFVGSDGNPSQSQSRFGILFTFTGQGKNPQSLTWNYENESDRDDDFDAILADNNSLGNLFRTNLTSGGQSPIVNLNNVLQASKYTSTFTGSNGNPSAAQNRFVILLTFKGHDQNPQALELKYENQEDRDDDYALILSQQVDPSGVQTLQQVLDNNHDLVDNNNFQGTGAGDGQGGQKNNFFGENAGANQSGNQNNIFGTDAGVGSQGDGNNFLGLGAGVGQTGNSNTFFGENAGAGQVGSEINGFGIEAARANEADHVNAFGRHSAQNNTGSNVNSFGRDAGLNNEGDDVNAFGTGAGQTNTLNGQTIFSNASFPSYADEAAAAAAITVLLGATAGCTYLYVDESDSIVKAIRL